MISREPVTPNMYLRCSFCTNKPEKFRFVLSTKSKMHNSSKSKILFCCRDHARRWFQMHFLEENKKYIYKGDTELYYGKTCTLVDLAEFKEWKNAKALVIIRFNGEKENWNCHANSLEFITEEWFDAR